MDRPAVPFVPRQLAFKLADVHWAIRDKQKPQDVRMLLLDASSRGRGFLARTLQADIIVFSANGEDQAAELQKILVSMRRKLQTLNDAKPVCAFVCSDSKT